MARDDAFRPKRGIRQDAINQNLILKDGEVFFEYPGTGIATGAGKIVMGDGETPYKDLPYFTGGSEGYVTSVNGAKPDIEGNVEITEVDYAKNISSDDVFDVYDNYIYRPTGAGADIESGDSQLTLIRGNYKLDDSDNIILAKPTYFKATGINQFKSTNTMYAYIDDSGRVKGSSSLILCYAKVPGGMKNGNVIYSAAGCIQKIGFSNTIPSIGDIITIDADGINVTEMTYDSHLSSIVNTNDGYICAVVTDPRDLCIHPRWSGSADTDYEEYSETIINIPLIDINGADLPIKTYGLPSVKTTRDELNFTLRKYIQRIGRLNNTEENMSRVVSSGVDYIYDANYIYYVLDNPIEYILDSGIRDLYTAHDFGTEEFVGTSVSVYSYSVYGPNLIDKLKRDVLTKSPQELTETEKSTVRDNIGAVDKAYVDSGLSNKVDCTEIGADKLFQKISKSDTNDLSKWDHIIIESASATSSPYWRIRSMRDVDNFINQTHYTKAEVDSELSGKANTSHTHDDRYYTESEVDTKLSGKANSSHTHDDRYYTESEINTKIGDMSLEGLPVKNGSVSDNLIVLKNYVANGKSNVATAIGANLGIETAATAEFSTLVENIRLGAINVSSGTATKSDVLSGKTFHAGGSTIHEIEGTMPIDAGIQPDTNTPLLINYDDTVRSNPNIIIEPNRYLSGPVLGYPISSYNYKYYTLGKLDFSVEELSKKYIDLYNKFSNVIFNNEIYYISISMYLNISYFLSAEKRAIMPKPTITSMEVKDEFGIKHRIQPIVFEQTSDFVKNEISQAYGDVLYAYEETIDGKSKSGSGKIADSKEFGTYSYTYSCIIGNTTGYTDFSATPRIEFENTIGALKDAGLDDHIKIKIIQLTKNRTTHSEE